MYCIKCGNELKDGESFCIKCGTKTNEKESIKNKEIEIKQKNSQNEETIPISKEDIKRETTIKKESKLNKCEFCGNEMLEDEKFCINCGRAVKEKISENKLNDCPLKQAIQNIFVNNKLLNIISKFAIVFALYYPIVLILKNLKLATDLIEILNNIDVIMFYGYYIALISLYANKKYMPLMLAILLRVTNSIIHLCVSGFGIVSIERICVILILLFYLFKELKETEEYKKFENKYKEIKVGIEAEIKVKICPKCGEKISESSAFCPKCGNRM